MTGTKDLKINGKLQRVFVLKQTEDRLVYIPIKSLHRVDYERLKLMVKEKPPRMDLLDFMAKRKLDNGRNALVQFDSLVQVCKLSENQAIRLQKPDEPQQQVEIDNATNKEPEVKEERKGNYVFTNKHGKEQSWSGKGRMPDALLEYAGQGGDIEDFWVPA